MFLLALRAAQVSHLLIYHQDRVAFHQNLKAFKLLPTAQVDLLSDTHAADRLAVALLECVREDDLLAVAMHMQHCDEAIRVPVQVKQPVEPWHGYKAKKCKAKETQREEAIECSS